MKSVDAVVIGAGVNGASTAYNLVKRGVKDVVLVDKYLIPHFQFDVLHPDLPAAFSVFIHRG